MTNNLDKTKIGKVRTPDERFDVMAAVAPQTILCGNKRLYPAGSLEEAATTPSRSDEESNAWIHLCIAFCVLVAGFVFKISTAEWITVILCIGFVFALELINTSIENMADFVSKEYQDLIKKTKDLAAGAVLVGAITAAIIGLIIFVPKIRGLLWLLSKQ